MERFLPRYICFRIARVTSYFSLFGDTDSKGLSKLCHQVLTVFDDIRYISVSYRLSKDTVPKGAGFVDVGEGCPFVGANERSTFLVNAKKRQKKHQIWIGTLFWLAVCGDPENHDEVAQKIQSLAVRVWCTI